MDVSKLSDSLNLEHALDDRMFEIGGTSITVATLMVFALIIVITLLVSWLLAMTLAWPCVALTPASKLFWMAKITVWVVTCNRRILVHPLKPNRALTLSNTPPTKCIWWCRLTDRVGLY